MIGIGKATITTPVIVRTDVTSFPSEEQIQKNIYKISNLRRVKFREFLTKHYLDLYTE